MFNSQGIVLHGSESITAVHYDSGMTVVKIDDGQHGMISVHVDKGRAAESLLIAAEVAHRLVVDTTAARSMAETIAEALLAHKVIPAITDALSQGDTPSILVDTDDGRSFIVSVREV